MGKEQISIRDIEVELQKVGDDLGGLEEEIKDGRWREALTQLRIIIDNVRKLIKAVQEYDPLNDVSDDAIAEICHNWGCECPGG
jgi:molybdopterin converting factor small subunit